MVYLQRQACGSLVSLLLTFVHPAQRTVRWPSDLRLQTGDINMKFVTWHGWIAEPSTPYLDGPPMRWDKASDSQLFSADFLTCCYDWIKYIPNTLHYTGFTFCQVLLFTLSYPNSQIFPKLDYNIMFQGITALLDFVSLKLWPFNITI